VPGHIVVVGSLNMDLVARTRRLPQPGETIIGSGFSAFPGGKGANQSVAAARLGAAVKMIGRVGVDAFGDSLLRALATDNVDTSQVRRDSAVPTGIAMITVDASGQNTIVVTSGANAQVTPEDVSAAEGIFESASALVVQLESPLETVTRAVEIAKKHRVRVILNPAPAQPLDAALLSRVDYLVPNRNELAQLSGRDSIREGVRRLQEIGVRGIVVTLGEEGALVVEGGRETHVGPHRVDVVDTTAAGDAFVGGFAVALSSGHSAVDAARWGNAAGALAATRAGAQPSLPCREEVARYMRTLELASSPNSKN
jgi:ribokinase